jgi:L-alanine-DL-glutamate epimerase-like enolase superfamily enzyme
VGAATAIELSRAGAAVAVCDIDLELAERVAAAIRESGGEAAAFGNDVSGPPECDRLRACASSHPSKGTIDEMAAEIAGYVGEGYTAVKVGFGKKGFARLVEDPNRDLEFVQAAREAIGDGVDLMVDAGYKVRWEVTQAIRIVRDMERYRIRWIEEPVRWDDQLEGLRLVREGSPIPVTAGQGEISRFGVRDLILHGRVSILNVEVTIAGGVTEWRRMAALASHFHVEMAHHEESQIALHLLASIPPSRARPALVRAARGAAAHP